MWLGDGVPEPMAAAMTSRRDLVLTGSSTFYRTSPVGGRDQPDFCNGVWRIETALELMVLKEEVLRGVESELGRKRSADRLASRTIDLDIILFGDRVIDKPGLKVPDPDIRRRRFVAQPLLELAPGLVLPDTGERLASILERMPEEELAPLEAFTKTIRSRISK